MREVFEDPAEGERRGAAAARTIAEEYSTEALARVIQQHLTAIRATPQYRLRREVQRAPIAEDAEARRGMGSSAVAGRRLSRRRA
jgi:hypothetical protein